MEISQLRGPTAICFQPGNSFKFKDDPKTYTFWELRFEGNKCLIFYEDDGVDKTREVDSLSVLVHA